jgi:hypothetical protein
MLNTKNYVLWQWIVLMTKKIIKKFWNYSLSIKLITPPVFDHAYYYIVYLEPSLSYHETHVKHIGRIFNCPIFEQLKQKIKLYIFLSMIKNESLVITKYFYS